MICKMRMNYSFNTPSKQTVGITNENEDGRPENWLSDIFD